MWLASMAIISVVIFVMICVLAGATFITNGRPSGIPKVIAFVIIEKGFLHSLSNLLIILLA